jgi:hypothetical protein
VHLSFFRQNSGLTDAIFSFPTAALAAPRSPRPGTDKEAGMNKMTFPNACQVMRWHFHPLGFEATMDAPRSMIARLFDRATGETLLAIAGIPCTAIMAAADVERIIEAVEAEMDAFLPVLALRDAS